MSQFLNRVCADNGSVPTYALALLQMIAYRNISEVVNQILQSYHLNTSKWIILNLVRLQPTRFRVTDLAEVLQVESTFVTNLVHELRQDEYLQLLPDPSDKRARLLKVTQKTKQLLDPLENELRQSLNRVVDGLEDRAVLQYARCLDVFVANTRPLRHI